MTNGVGVASDGSTFMVSKDGKIQVAVADTSSRLGGSTSDWDGSTKSVTVTTSNSQLVTNLGIDATGSAADAISNSYKDSLKNSSGNLPTQTPSKNTDTIISQGTGLLGLGNHAIVNPGTSNPYGIMSGTFNDVARDAQICLTSLQYNVGGCDGLYGTTTTKNILDFQKKYGS